MTNIKSFETKDLIGSYSKEAEESVTTIKWREEEIGIKKYLSLKDMLEFVDKVVKSCFLDDGTYLPEIEEFVIRVCILEKYTNFELPTNTQDKYSLVYCTDIINAISIHIDAEQLSEIRATVSKKINHQLRLNVESSHRKFEELYSAFSNLQTNIEQLFSGIDTENVNSMLSAFNNGSFDEKKIVDAYMDRKNKEIQ